MPAIPPSSCVTSQPRIRISSGPNATLAIPRPSFSTGFMTHGSSGAACTDTPIIITARITEATTLFPNLMGLHPSNYEFHVENAFFNRSEQLTCSNIILEFEKCKKKIHISSKMSGRFLRFPRRIRRFHPISPQKRRGIKNRRRSSAGFRFPVIRPEPISSAVRPSPDGS